MFVKFHSDGSQQRKGFSASFKKEAIGPFPCGDVLAESGKIQSFNYPNDYPNNEDCIWKITVPSGSNVMLEFETPFDIERCRSRSDCSYDYLEIRDGGAATSPFLGEKLCGTTVPNTIKSTGNTMFVKFHSDGSQPRIGFSASFKKEDNFRCPTENSGYRILEDRCYFFEKVDRDYSVTQEYCKTAFGPNVVGKLWEPKSLKINNVVGAEAENIFGYNRYFWIGISNDGKFRYQSSGETATWDMPYYNKYQKTGRIGTSFCLYYNLYDSKWRTGSFCTGSGVYELYTVCEIDN